MGRTLFLGEIIGPDILIILIIVMVLFGSAKIPKLARSLGQASHEFRKGLDEGVTDKLLAPPPPAPADTATPAPADTATPAPADTATPAPAETAPPAHPGPAAAGTDELTA
jgi:sec-independent protein translocase protein TatA